MRNPAISVVMGVYNDAEYLAASIDSVVVQTDSDFEFIIVNDGSTATQVETILVDYARRDSRIQVITKSNEGLTRALIDGCAAAKGAYIARIDVGDVMLPERLEKQRAVLNQNPDAVLVTCWTECCGPEWEHLYTTQDKGLAAADESVWIANVMPAGDKEDLLDGPAHHGSVMFRAGAYRAAGGYRAAFYYGQDWDLWYRIAEHRKFSGVREVLYRCRIFPEGISMRNVERQRQIHACSRGAFQARLKGETEQPFLQCAAALRPSGSTCARRPSLGADFAGWYFIGESLRRNRNTRCRTYLLNAVAAQPWNPKGWLRLLQSFFLQDAARFRNAV